MASRSPPSSPSVGYRSDKWHDEETMAFHFRDFRAKEVNPEGFNSKMAWWLTAIDRWTREENAVPFTIADVQQAFERDNGAKPNAAMLKLVLTNLMLTPDVLTLEQFMCKCQNAKHAGWISWGVATAVKPLSWGLSWLSGEKRGAAADEREFVEQVSTAIRDDSKFVNVALLEQLAERLVCEIDRCGQRVYRVDLLQTRAAEMLNVNARALDLLLVLLESRNKVTMTVDHGIRVVKFGAAFTELELALLRLDAAKEMVEADIKKSEQDLTTLKNDARACVRDKCNLKARQLLKRKQRLEAQMAKKEAQLDNIDFLLHQLSEADSHAMVLRAYEEGAEMLKSAQLKVNIDATIADLEDALADDAELRTALATPITGALGGVDDAALDDELEQLLAEETPGKMLTPAVATDTPKRKKTDEVEIDELVNRLNELRSAPAHDPATVGDEDEQPRAGMQSAAH